MTDKEFVISIYPDAECKIYPPTPKGNYNLIVYNRGRETFAWYVTTEKEAWRLARKSIEKDFLYKLESQ
jgi:hypothetical protein